MSWKSIHYGETIIVYYCLFKNSYIGNQAVMINNKFFFVYPIDF